MVHSSSEGIRTFQAHSTHLGDRGAMKFNLKMVAGVGAAMLFAGNANAAVLTAVSADYSKEGITTTGDVTLPTVTAVLAADYKADDKVTFTVSGASLINDTNLTAQINCPNAAGNGICSSNRRQCFRQGTGQWLARNRQTGSSGAGCREHGLVPHRQRG